MHFRTRTRSAGPKLVAALLAFAVTAVLAPSVAAGAPGTETAPSGAEYDAHRVIVSYRPGVGAAERRPLDERVGVRRTIERIPAADAELVRVAGDPLAVSERLENSPKVAYAEPDVLMSAQARPSDELFRSLWGLHNRGQTGGRRGADIGALAGWRRAGVGNYPRRGGVRVGVIDTGIRSDHQDLSGKVAACVNMRTDDILKTCDDDTGHGTHVAGTLAAIADNGVGVTGVAFNSPLLVCRALGGLDRSGFVSDIAQCVGWAHGHGARVISMSLAGPGTDTLRRAVRGAWRKGSRRGAVLVAAAGNHGGYSAQYPAAYPQVVSVGATNDRDRHAGFSNRHHTLELGAPGVGILSTWHTGGYTRLSGTSMAVPHVSGVAAQLRSLRPRMRAARARREMARSAADRGPRGHDSRFGYGRVDLARAVSRVR